MFNPLQNEALDEWFQSFNAPLKRLPAEERAELHQEVRQHLEDLVAANEELGSSPHEAWELALAQFGDPARIGRRLRREALTLPSDPNRWASNPLMAACLYSFVVCTLGMAAVWAVAMASWSLMEISAPALPEGDPWHSLVKGFFGCGVMASSACAGWLSGRRMEKHAVTGPLCVLSSLGGPPTLLLLLADHDVSGAAGAVAWIGLGCLSAWVAARKRGHDGLELPCQYSLTQNARRTIWCGGRFCFSGSGTTVGVYTRSSGAAAVSRAARWRWAG